MEAIVITLFIWLLLGVFPFWLLVNILRLSSLR